MPSQSTSRPVSPTRLFRRGFTVIELLVTLVIMGVLVSLVISHIQEVKSRAYIDVMLSDLKNYALAEELHFDRFSTYGDTAALRSGVGFALGDRVAIDSASSDASAWYLRLIHGPSGIRCHLQTHATNTDTDNKTDCFNRVGEQVFPVPIWH
jgi:prepilin-type N-terminal cleavage/methylation domain-containing protein